MRQLATLPDADTARKLAGYLQSQSIETRLDESPDGIVLWILDEDRVARVREILQHFQSNPQDERYGQVPSEEPRQEDRPRRRTADADAPWSVQPQYQLTLGLIVLSVLITALYHSGPQKPLVARYAFITAVTIKDDDAAWYRGLPEVKQGEVWRLVTPIFIHFDVFHLLFNMLWLFEFGRQIERRSGPIRLALLVILIAVVSNLCQYLFSEISLSGLLYWINPWEPAVENPPSIIGRSSPLFGGMSGVGFGLFGYIWVRSIHEPGCELHLDPRNVALFLGWMVLCFTGLVGPVANVAHLVGLSMGMILGYAVAWWHGLSEPEA